MEKATETKATLSKEDALKALEKDKSERVANCTKAIGDILSQYDCRIDVSVTLREDSIKPRVTVVSN